MKLSIILAVGMGGFAGAIARFYVSRMIASRFSTSFPYGTLTVNLIGSFALGWLFGTTASTFIFAWLGIGFLGAFTTFSTFAVENIRLLQEKRWKIGLLYMGTSYFAGILLAMLGYFL